MAFYDWLSLVAIALLGAASPGPSLAVVASNTLAATRWHGLATAWAHSIGIGVYALLTVFGLALAMKAHPTVFSVISYAGAAYLAWLGGNALLSRGGVAHVLNKGEALSISKAARQGLMISLLNPKIGLFFVALFSQFIDEKSSLNDQLVTLLTPVFTDGLWFSFMVMLLSQPSVLDTLKRNAKWVDRTTGVVLLAVALKIILN